MKNKNYLELPPFCYDDKIESFSKEELELAELDDMNIHMVITSNDEKMNYLGLEKEEIAITKTLSSDEIKQLDNLTEKEIRIFLKNKVKKR